MASRSRKNGLHLPSLAIEGFRGVDSLTLPILGRVNLFAGKNGIGKTTVLEAVQLYASRGNEDVVHEIVKKREEFDLSAMQDIDDLELLNLDTLFFGRNPELETRVTIGPKGNAEKIKISVANEDDVFSKHLRKEEIRSFANQGITFLKVEYKKDFRLVSGLSDSRSPYRRIRRLPRENGWPPAIVCHWMGPGILSNALIARFWDQVALTDEENIAVYALGLVMDDNVERITMVGDESNRFRGRKAIVRLGNQSPVPLKSLGDGAVRLFTTALAMTNCTGGFLLIDEAENGIHHSVQRHYWKMVLDIASRNNIQVFATTHSIDCVRGFSQAALESKEDGVLFRLEKKEQGVKAIRYSEAELEAATRLDTEVR